jgi:hypothetical protein
MALTDLLPDFGSVDILDPLFQKLVARGVPRREAQQWILRALKSEGLIIMLRVASGARALYPRQFTPEEEAQAQEEYRTRAANFEFDALDEILHERSPPEGIIGPAYPEDWGRSLDLAIRDGHLVIEFLFPKFPPESYAFTIANPEAVDELLAAAFSSTRIIRRSKPESASTGTAAAAAPCTRGRLLCGNLVARGTERLASRGSAPVAAQELSASRQDASQQDL